MMERGRKPTELWMMERGRKPTGTLDERGKSVGEEGERKPTGRDDYHGLPHVRHIRHEAPYWSRHRGASQTSLTDSQMR
jgi:hypothetical protein